MNEEKIKKGLSTLSDYAVPEETDESSEAKENYSDVGIFDEESRVDEKMLDEIWKDPDDDASEKSDEASFYSSAKLFGKSEEEMTAEFKNYKAQKLLKKISLMLTDPYVPLAEFEEKLVSAKSMGLKGASVLYDRVEYALDKAGEGFPVSVCVCFPYASDDFRSKVVAVKKAVRFPVNAVEVPLNMTDVTEKNYRRVESEYAKLKRIVGKKDFVLITDVSFLTPNDMNLLSRICKDVGISNVKTSCAMKGSRVDDIALNNLKAVLGDGVNIIACSSTSNDKDVVGFFAVGATEYSGTEAIELAESIKRVILA